MSQLCHGEPAAWLTRSWLLNPLLQWFHILHFGASTLQQPGYPHLSLDLLGYLTRHHRAHLASLGSLGSHPLNVSPQEPQRREAITPGLRRSVARMISGYDSMI